MPKKTETREQLLLEIQRLQEEVTYDHDTPLSASKQWTGPVISGRGVERLCEALWNVFSDDAQPSPYCVEDEDYVEFFQEDAFKEGAALLPIGEIKQALRDLLKLLQRGNATHVVLYYERPSRLVRLTDTPVETLKKIRKSLMKIKQQETKQAAAQEAEVQRRRQEEQLLELARTIGIEKAIRTLQEK